MYCYKPTDCKTQLPFCALEPQRRLIPGYLQETSLFFVGFIKANLKYKLEAPRSFTSEFEVLSPTNAAKTQGKSRTNEIQI